MNTYTRLLASWMRFVHDNAWLVILTALMVTGLLGWYTAANVRINSDLPSLIKQDAQWRLDYDEIRAAFPQFVDNATIAVYGDSLSEVENTTEQLRDKLLAVDGMFEFVYAPQVDPFFKEHSLLFLEEDRLAEVIDQLAEMQPALTALSEDPSLRGLFDLLQTGLDNIDDEELPSGFTELLDIVAGASEDVVAGKSAKVAWGDQFLAEGEADDTQFRLIYVKGKQNLDQALPHKEVMLKLREVVASLELPAGSSIKIGLTGEVPLAHEEIEAARNGAQQAGIVSLILLAIILGFGVRNWRVIFAIYASLLVGLVWTAAYAVAAVGEYNTLSIIFTVMFIGLGVDFTIHFCLRYQEALSRRAAGLPALAETSRSIGAAISLCGVTSAVGFAAFAPTEYVGLADLGVICAGGMIIALFCSFTLIPAIFAVIGAPTAHRDEHTSELWFYKFWAQHGWQVAMVLGVLTLVAVLIASRSQFDYSVLALKDPKSDSMATHVVLQENHVRTDYTLSVLTTLEEAPALSEKLKNLPVVEKVRVPADYIPDNQDEKLETLEDASLMLWSALFPTAQMTPPNEEERLQSVQVLYAKLNAVSDHPKMVGELKVALERLLATLKPMLAETNSSELATQLDNALVSEINEELDWLRAALQAESFT
ncbi:MAG: MMPL family transporter, partial [Pseudomonadota bacterium]